MGLVQCQGMLSDGHSNNVFLQEHCVQESLNFPAQLQLRVKIKEASSIKQSHKQMPLRHI